MGLCDIVEESANHPGNLNMLKVKRARVTVWTRRQKRIVKGRMLARCCHALLRDAYAPIRGTTNLERHLLFGKCKLVSEKYTLLDTAKLAYAKKVQEGFTTQPTLAAPTTTEVSSEAPLVQGWALKGTKKATRFNENQRQYFDNKFQIEQESGHKVDPEKVSRDMRYARKDNGERRFDVEEFLTAQQIQSYFSRTAAKLKHAITAQSGK